MTSPETAIQAFERIHRLHVTIHDLRGNLAPLLHVTRAWHRDPLCRCVKAGGGESKCVNFEMFHLRREAHALAEGRFHVCHAGLVEWVLPVYRGAAGLELEWMLFAGVRTPGPGVGSAIREVPTRWAQLPWNPGTPLPPPVDATEAEDILEHLRQLGARLSALVRGTDAPRPTAAASEGLDRAALIRRFIQANSNHPEIRLGRLARELGVSEDRATHVIRETCGRTYRELLTEARLNTARELLRLSALPILEVALASGFVEVAHFNRLFRRETGLTPTAYRRKSSHFAP